MTTAIGGGFLSYIKDSVTCHSSLPFQLFNWERESSIGLITTIIKNKYFCIYEINYNSLQYLIIDCNTKINIEDFYNISVSISIALGFFASYFRQDECFIIGANDSEYHDNLYVEYRSLRESVSIPFKFLDRNSFNYFEEKEAMKHINDMPVVKQEQFDLLVNLCYEDLEILNCLFVFIVSSCYPLDTQPACISVAMEGICNFIMKKNKDVINPINDKNIAKDIRKRIIELLKTYEGKIEKNNLKILEKRIENLNSPTNLEKLLKPYEILGINLKEYEITALKNRNNFLHSNLHFEIGREIKNKQRFYGTSNFLYL
jgi:hypothetical protein